MELTERARQVLPGGVTRAALYVPPHPPYVAKGAGARLVDTNGHEVIDCNNNYSALIHGHAHPQLIEVAKRALECGSSFGLPTESEVAMAELLAARIGLPQWRFCNSGTEAVMMAVQAARLATGRELCIRFEGSYHGSYDDVMDGALAEVTTGRQNRVLVLPPADGDTFAEAMSRVGESVAAVIVDPMPNRAGLVPVPKEILELIRRTTEDVGAKLIFDEVITLRLAPGGMQTLHGVSPDITTVGKTIGGGFPAGGIGATHDVMKVFDPATDGRLRTGGTFTANPVTMSVGAEALRLLDTDTIADLNSHGEQLRELLRANGIRVNGHGSLLRIMFNDPTTDWWRLYHEGVLVCANGLLSLSTVMTGNDLTIIAQRIADSIGRQAS